MTLSAPLIGWLAPVKALRIRQSSRRWVRKRPDLIDTGVRRATEAAPNLVKVPGEMTLEIAGRDPQSSNRLEMRV